VRPGQKVSFGPHYVDGLLVRVIKSAKRAACNGLLDPPFLLNIKIERKSHSFALQRMQIAVVLCYTGLWLNSCSFMKFAVV
jgi:hypothetical protein